MLIFSIDPGNEQSAYVEYNSEQKAISRKGIETNDIVLQKISELLPDRLLLIEMVESFGMPVGRSVFETVFWIGRFWQAANCTKRRIYRKSIKLHHCGSIRAKDSNIIQALKDKYGDKGTKNSPGFFYGFKADMWQAFAICSYFIENKLNPLTK